MTTITSAAICSPLHGAGWCGWRFWCSLSFFTSEVIAANEDVLQQVVLLAAFIPLLGGTGGNVGAQSSTVVIRGLSTQSISALRTVKGRGPQGDGRGPTGDSDDDPGGAFRLVAR